MLMPRDVAQQQMLPVVPECSGSPVVDLPEYGELRSTLLWLREATPDPTTIRPLVFLLISSSVLDDCWREVSELFTDPTFLWDGLNIGGSLSGPEKCCV